MTATTTLLPFQPANMTPAQLAAVLRDRFRAMLWDVYGATG